MRNCTYRRRLGRVWGGPKIMFLQFPNFIEPNFPNYVLLETNSMCSDRARQPAIKLIQFFSILGRRKQQPSPTSPKSPPMHVHVNICIVQKARVGDYITWS